MSLSKVLKVADGIGALSALIALILSFVKAVYFGVPESVEPQLESMYTIVSTAVIIPLNVIGSIFFFRYLYLIIVSSRLIATSKVLWVLSLICFPPITMVLYYFKYREGD